jgi:hypothetical protein
MGEVIGFVLSGESLPTVYISGDNASPDAVALFAGDAERPHVGEEPLTLPSDLAAEAVRILNVQHAIPIHLHHRCPAGAEEALIATRPCSQYGVNTVGRPLRVIRLCGCRLRIA